MAVFLNFGGSVGPASLESPTLVNLYQREKPVYSTTHKAAINRPADRTGETKHTIYVSLAVFY